MSDDRDDRIRRVGASDKAPRAPYSEPIGPEERQALVALARVAAQLQLAREAAEAKS